MASESDWIIANIPIGMILFFSIMFALHYGQRFGQRMTLSFENSETDLGVVSILIVSALMYEDHR